MRVPAPLAPPDAISGSPQFSAAAVLPAQTQQATFAPDANAVTALLPQSSANVAAAIAMTQLGVSSPIQAFAPTQNLAQWSPAWAEFGVEAFNAGGLQTFTGFQGSVFEEFSPFSPFSDSYYGADASSALAGGAPEAGSGAAGTGAPNLIGD
jgi:hypothetical protein